MRGNSMNGGATNFQGNSFANGGSLLRLVKSQQDVGWNLRPATIYDGDEPMGIA